jgi:SET domain-containing protein
MMMEAARPKKTTSPYIVIRPSRIHSNGVFARQDIAAGTRVIEYVGEKLTKAQAVKRADIPLQRHAQNKARGAVYLFELNKRCDIDGDVPYNTARNINHSCDPNCETDIIRGRVWIIARRDIKNGEEITYNYGYGFEEYEDHQCRCGSQRCMGYILAEDHWPKLKRRLTRERNLRAARKVRAG